MHRRTRLFIVGTSCLIAACNTNPSDDTTSSSSSETASTPPAQLSQETSPPTPPPTAPPPPPVASTAKKRFYGIESFTIVHKHEGMQTGTVTEHVRDWGNERVEIRKLEMKVGPITQQENKRVITKGESITTIDLETNTAKRAKNSMYAAMTSQVQGDNAIDFGKKMLMAMGGKETGETASYGGESCKVWEMAQMMQKSCITADGLTVFTENTMANLKDTAIEVRKGDPGPKEAYEVPADLSVTEMGDPFEMLKKLREGAAQGQ